MLLIKASRHLQVKAQVHSYLYKICQSLLRTWRVLKSALNISQSICLHFTWPLISFHRMVIKSALKVLAEDRMLCKTENRLDMLNNILMPY